MTSGTADSPKVQRGFSSDNASGVHPEVLAAIAQANIGHAPSYGNDHYTSIAESLLEHQFGEGSSAYLVFNGTGANVASLSALLRPHQAVICASDAHVMTDECGALQRFAGSGFLQVETANGKLTPERVSRAAARIVRGEHQSPPGIVSITNATELGTVYRPEEVAALAEWAHGNGMFLHMDGARLSNAAAGLGCALGQVSIDAGVDALTFGGTKNGLLLGEAVIFSARVSEEPGVATFRYIRKQFAQLPSKMRFIGAQFIALMNDSLWRRNALAANAAARDLAQRLANVEGVEIVQPVEANAVFARMEDHLARKVADGVTGHVWDASTGTVRMICSFDTDRRDVSALVARVRRAARKHREQS